MKSRLCILYLLQFAVWGCYLTSFGQLLGTGGLGQQIFWFYAAIGIVSIATPPLMGYIGDKYAAPEKMLGLCHLLAAIYMGLFWYYAETHQVMDFGVAFPLYMWFLAFYMPSLALANATTLAILKRKGNNPIDDFPRIRIWGTVGFVAAMWFVNSAWWHEGTLGFTLSDSSEISVFRFQYTARQLLSASVLGFLTAAYTLTLPRSPKDVWKQDKSPKIFPDFTPYAIFKKPKIRNFLLCSILIGVCLQISNAYVTPFISHFLAFEEYRDTLAAGNSTMLFSLSQISEAICILLVGVTMRRFGIRGTVGLAMLAWTLRFGLLAFGNPGPGLWMLVMSMAFYGFAFDFYNVAASIYMEQSGNEMGKGFAQGVFMQMSNGIGATAGTIVAGAVVNHWCRWEMVSLGAGKNMRLFMGDWNIPWTVFAAYAFVVGIIFIISMRKAASGK